MADFRKDYILNSIEGLFHLDKSSSLSNQSYQEINKFFDDPSCEILTISKSENEFIFSNAVPSSKEDKKAILFVKNRPEVITEENIHSSVIVLSITSSPSIVLYHTLQKVYSPMLLKDDDYASNSKLQKLLNDLEVSIGSVIRKSSDKSQDGQKITLEEIQSVTDEYLYWSDNANQSHSSSERERALHFQSLLEPLQKPFSALDSMSYSDCREFIELLYNLLDDIWRQEQVTPGYPQKHMAVLLNVIGSRFVRYVQNQLSNLDLWMDTYSVMEDAMQQGIFICNSWSDICEKLTKTIWPGYAIHPWNGSNLTNSFISNFCLRLQKVSNLMAGLLLSLTFFDIVTAVAKFEQALAPAEQRVALKLRNILRSKETNALQLMQEFKRFQQLIKRPTITKELSSEREMLLGQLKNYVKTVSRQFNSQSSDSSTVPNLPNTPETMSQIMWIRQLQAKLDDVKKVANILLDDLDGYKPVITEIQYLSDEFTEHHSNQFDNWCQDIHSQLKDGSLSLEVDRPVVELDSQDQPKVNYNSRLVSLIREVRQLNVLGYRIPAKILEVDQRAKQYYRQAKELQQVVSFYKTIADHMIKCQQPMMISAANTFTKLLLEQKGITWDDPQSLINYVSKLQVAVENLSRENRKLRKYHYSVCEKVVSLMSMDLLRQQHKWKDVLNEIRGVIAKLLEQNYALDHMRPWRAHWDRQLYKSLEHQFQLGLETLNEHLPEIKIDLVFRQQKLQFRPPMEEIKTKYFNQLKRFLSIPNNFKGVNDVTENLIFPVMLERNSQKFKTVYSKANELFYRLDKVKEKFQNWVALGAVNLTEFIDLNCKTLEDWKLNFRSVKSHSQEFSRQLSADEEKVDCITVSFGPVKTSIEYLISEWDFSMVGCLGRSILSDANVVETFLKDSMEILMNRPQSVTEIGEANAKHTEFCTKRNEMYQLYVDAENKNDLLGKWAKKSIQQVSGLRGRWDHFETLLNEHETLISQQVEVLKKKVRGEVDRFNKDLERFSAHWQQKKPKDDSLDGNQSEILQKIQVIKEKSEEFQALIDNKNRLMSDCSHFGLAEPEFPLMDNLSQDLEGHAKVWFLFEEFNASMQTLAKEEWIVFRSKVYMFEELLNEWKEKLEGTNSNKEPTTVTLRLLKEIEKYQDVLPLLKFCRGDMFSQQHWMDMYRLIGIPSNIPVEKLTLSNFLDAKDTIVVNAEAIKELNGRAQGEVTIREALNELDLWGAKARFNLTEFEDSNHNSVMLIKDWKDILNKVGDNQCLLQSLKDTPYYQNFVDRASIWETRLADLDMHLQNLNQIQRKWVYLEPIFGRGALPNEQSRFKRVDDDFKSIMSYVARNDHVIALVNITGLGSTLSTLLDQLHRCQKSLNEFLEKINAIVIFSFAGEFDIIMLEVEEKRTKFPRFYFIGDDDLLEILGRSTDPRVIQTHLKKLFAGIHSVEFDENHKHIIAIKSAQGEVVPLLEKVLITSDVEVYLESLSNQMKETLRQLLQQCVSESGGAKQLDPSKYPSQILCLAELVNFTKQCEQAINGKSLSKFKTQLEEQLESYTSCDLSQNDVLVLKLKALILDIIHNVQVVEKLIQCKVQSPDEWLWQKQLRFYISEGNVEVCMVDARFSYTYEYQGNAAKLVHTPLTDKCYLTLTQGMHMGMGGNPYGPAGTGKTESVKALGSVMGRQVLVFNCDEGIDVKSMGRIFIGLVKCGAWGCFDEFNRLEEEVMSAVSMQIQTIQAAFKNNTPIIQLLDRKITINPNAGIFITMNPAGKGYGGRQKLPDNLKQLFRPVAMSQPDVKIISEVILFSEGFKNVQSLSRKLVAVFNLARGLLTRQQHYDWGLRALKTVLKGCGNLLHLTKNSQSDEEKKIEQDETFETRLVVQALRLNTLSKLTYFDCKQFDDLIKDVFTGVNFNDISYQELAEITKETITNMGLVVNESQVKKVLELYEQLQQRMGVVIVGPSGSGKTTLWKVLRQSLAKLHQEIKLYTVNPKAMPRTQLLGHIDIDTREWVDGVLTKSSRQVIKESLDVTSWIICDGDIDPEWIESLNSVLDDNHLLTMPSGERIQFGSNVNFIFETHDLSCASPATISRMGMIFLSDENTDVKAYVQSWLNLQPDNVKQNLGLLIEDYFYRALEWVLKLNEFVVNVSLVGVVKNGLSYMYNVINKPQFLMALINGLGSNLSEINKEAFARALFSWMNEMVPDQQNPLNSYYDAKKDRLEAFQSEFRDDISLTSLAADSLPLVKTASVQQAIANIMPWLSPENQQPFILVGPEGCGKSLVLQHCFQQIRSTQVATIHCSAETSPEHILQKLLHVCMVINTNTGRVYRPKDSERLILYMKDLNLPKPDSWGTCQLIAFLHQLVTYNGFYDTNLEWVGIDGIQFIGSMSGSRILGRHELNMRFTSVVRICVISHQKKEEMQSIYNCYLKTILSSNLPNHSVWSSSDKIQNLASSMVQLFDQVKTTFTADEHSHYQFTPQHLTMWVLGLLRYYIDSEDHSPALLLEAWSYEACQIFRSKLVNNEAKTKFDNLLSNILRSNWGVNFPDLSSKYLFYVSWGPHKSIGSAKNQPLFGKVLSKLEKSDFEAIVDKGITHFNHEMQDSNQLIFQEVLEMIAFMDHVLSQPGGSALLAGQSGVGHQLTTCIVAHMLHMVYFTPKVTRGYSVKNFKNDLKIAFQLAGIEGEQVVLVIEDHHIIDHQVLELVNSVLSSGEVPGLYTTEELDPLLSPLRDQASQDGFRGTIFSYFASRVRKNLHVVLVMDYTDSNFTVNCERNPAFYKCCSFLWTDGWSTASLSQVKLEDKSVLEVPCEEILVRGCVDIHNSCPIENVATPRRFISFLCTYISIYCQKKDGIENRRKHLQAGVSKLNEARNQVQKLKVDANEQSKLLAEKQAEADAALKQITLGMEVHILFLRLLNFAIGLSKTKNSAGDQKTEMEKLKDQTEIENEKLEKRKEAIDIELTEIEPLVQEAKAAVGNIRSDALSEIRSLRAPPDIIRDILEGVLRLMGIFDTSWVSMKSFLARRGIKEEICNFDARRITPEIRQSNAKRASHAAAPLAVWVQANVKYSYVLQKINPLEMEQSKLKENLSRAESRMGKLSSALTDVDQTVSELRNRLNKFTKEAAEIEINLNKANSTINAAETLVTELDDEYQRWTQQLQELATELENLPLQSLLASAFISYLPSAPEDVRHKTLDSWASLLGLESFDVRRFLSSEKEQLTWKNEGLPQDSLSMENALIVLQANLRPFLIDPSSRATEWLKTHLKDSRLEIIHQQDVNFVTTLELAVRFGKTLIIQEVDCIEPVLYPVLRGDLISQGSRHVVQIGDKLVDYNQDFDLYMTTRKASLELPAFASSIITKINFKTTEAGLRGQLLAVALQHEKPELEVRKTELLHQEEEMKLQVTTLEETLLKDLADSQGNILDNQDLLASLKKTKSSSSAIATALDESVKLQSSLDKERDAYLSLAEFGSHLFFAMTDLCKLSNMYRFSLSAFLRLFQRALKTEVSKEEVSSRIQSLIRQLLILTFDYVSRSLFKSDRLTFALHLIHGMYPDLFADKEWDAFSGMLISDLKVETEEVKHSLPNWIDEDRALAVALFKNTFPSLFQTLHLDDGSLWKQFSISSHCETEIPASVARQLTQFQQVLVIQALRPDRLLSGISLFASRALNLKELSLPILNLKKLYQMETICTEPILMIMSPGADPSQELQELANQIVGESNYIQIPLGQGQSEYALSSLRECSKNGQWLCLKNLHLVIKWLYVLEKVRPSKLPVFFIYYIELFLHLSISHSQELNSLEPHENFRLWLTSESHPNFSSILLESSLKITFEAPPGIKQNLLRTYDSWSSDSKNGSLHQLQLMFSLALFHAVLQERRIYIPQGWTKFYEFNSADLRAAVDVIERLFKKNRNLSTDQLNFIYGLYESAIYGGRVDNPCDVKVLCAYLRQYFNKSVSSASSASNRNAVAGNITLPSSEDIQDYISVIGKLSDEDKPSQFGLPSNIDRSMQKTSSSHVISQLKIVMSKITTNLICKDLNTYDLKMRIPKCLLIYLHTILMKGVSSFQGSQLIQIKVSPPAVGSGKASSIVTFYQLEHYNSIRLVQAIHASLAKLSKVIRGTTLVTSDVYKLAQSLLNHQVPDAWWEKWEGPDDPMQYMRQVIFKTNMIKDFYMQSDHDPSRQKNIDLSSFFHPDIYLSAVSQQVSREFQVPMDTLKLATNWKEHQDIVGARWMIRVSGLQLEGCMFDGNRLLETESDSPSVTTAPTCNIAFVTEENYAKNVNENTISLPLYISEKREKIITYLDTPCKGDHDKWVLAGAAFYIKELSSIFLFRLLEGLEEDYRQDKFSWERTPNIPYSKPVLINAPITQAETVLESEGQLDAGALELQMFDSRYMVKDEYKKQPKDDKCFRPSCCPVAFLMILITLLVIILPVVQELSKSDDYDAATDLKNCQNCQYVIVETIPKAFTSNVSEKYDHVTTFQSWMNLIAKAQREIHIISSNIALKFSNISDQNENLSTSKLLARSSVQVHEITIIFYTFKLRIRNKHDDLKGATIIEAVQSKKTPETQLWLVDNSHLYMGSASMGRNLISEAKELGIVIYNCSCIGEDMEKIFQDYWQKSIQQTKTPFKTRVERQRCSNSKYNMSNPMKIAFNSTEESQLYIAGSTPEHCLIGRTSDIEAIISVIENAHSFIFIAIMEYIPLILHSNPKRFWSVIDDKLREAAYMRGVFIKILVNYGESSSPAMLPFLKSLSALTSTNISIDVVSRSSSWSGDSLVEDNGIAIVINVTSKKDGRKRTIRDQLEAIFKRDWNSKFIKKVSEF
ncbi:Cytoplasmic dynein 2 heavy chain 1 [Nymphon striatum]|nr:Cytoplasmic dynein 2 heavy chain 1 [Nymphon striatum]